MVVVMMMMMMMMMMMLGRPPSRSRRFWTRKNLLVLPEFEPRSVHPVA